LWIDEKFDINEIMRENSRQIRLTLMY